MKCISFTVVTLIVAFLSAGMVSGAEEENPYSLNDSYIKAAKKTIMSKQAKAARAKRRSAKMARARARKSKVRGGESNGLGTSTTLASPFGTPTPETLGTPGRR